MEQNYQLELKHLAPRVSAAVLQKKAGLKPAGSVLFMDFTGLTTKERLDGRKRELVSANTSSSRAGKGHQCMQGI